MIDPLPTCRRALVALACAATLLAPARASAKDPSSAEVEIAKGLVKDAIVEQRAGHCNDALALLDQAAAIRHSTEILLHRGECLVELGRLREAIQAFQEGQDFARAEGDKLAQRNLGQKAEQTRDRMPLLVLTWPLGVDSATVQLDGHELSFEDARKPIVVDPGAHELRVRAPGRRPFEAKVQVDEKQTQKIELSLPAEQRPHEEAPARAPGLPAVTWAAGGAALALGGSGALAFVLSGGVASDAEASCAQRPRCSDTSRSTVRNLDGLALGLWIGAGVAAGVAVTWAVVRPGEPDRVEATAVVGPGTLGVGARF